MIRIGITEAGDAGMQLDWTTRMDTVDHAILITKCLRPEFLAALVPFAARALVHVTCTGYGGSRLEPRVPAVAWTRQQYTALLRVVPAGQTVLRLDPIIPTPRGLAVAHAVLTRFADSPIQRVRFSYLDMYPHVADRFAATGLPHPYDGQFHLSPRQRDAATAMLERWRERYHLEACAEPGFAALPCISVEDAGPLHFPPDALHGSAGQRRCCGCPRNKVQLLTHRGPCSLQCVYCYWRDVSATPAAVPAAVPAAALA